jgi:hypothetical protein
VIKELSEPGPRLVACTVGHGPEAENSVTRWIGSILTGFPKTLYGKSRDANSTWLDSVPPHNDVIAAYSPSRNLRHIPVPNLSRPLRDPRADCLAFESTVQNESIQTWLLSLYSKRAIARERQLPTEEYTESLGRFEAALRLLYGKDVTFQVEIKPSSSPACASWAAT